MNTTQSIDLVGVRGFSAWQTYNAMINHISLSAVYRNDDFMMDRGDGETKTPDLEKIISHFKALNETQKMSILWEIMGLYPLSDEQILSLVRVHKDRNGVYVSDHSLKNFHLNSMIEMVLKTCVECSDVSSDLFF